MLKAAACNIKHHDFSRGHIRQIYQLQNKNTAKQRYFRNLIVSK